MSYVSEVARLFQLHFPEVTILGPEDYTAIADWEKRKIPIEIVERTFSNHPNSRDVGSVVQLERTLKENFRLYLASGR